MPLSADRLKRLRERKNLTQLDLAQSLSVSQQQVARWESGASDASADAIARLARTLRCSADFLLGLVEQPHQMLQDRPLSADEQQLLELYRARRLPQMIQRLVNELAGAQSQKHLVVNGLNQPQVSTDDVPLDG